MNVLTLNPRSSRASSPGCPLWTLAQAADKLRLDQARILSLFCAHEQGAPKPLRTLYHPYRKYYSSKALRAFIIPRIAKSAGKD